MSDERRQIEVTTDWAESNCRMEEWLSTLSAEERKRFLANHAVIAERMGIPAEECPLAAGFTAPVPDDPMSDPVWRAAIERGRQLAKEYGW